MPEDPATAAGRWALVINGRFLTQPITGVQRVARELTREIDNMIDDGRLRADVTLLCPPSVDATSLRLRHIAVRNIGRSQGALWEQLFMPLAVRSRTLLCLGNTAPIWSLLFGRTAVLIHDLSYLHFPEAYRRRYRLGHRLMLPLLLARAVRIFTVSRSERERILQRAGGIERKTVIAPNGGWTSGVGIEVDAARSSFARMREPYALYVGSLSHRKNFDRSLQAAIVLAREDGIASVFVGSSGKVLRKPVIDIPDDVKDKIVFLDQIDSKYQLGQLYERAHLLLFPTLYEASPLPPVEAGYFKCPVVASNIPSMWERCGEGVEYCDPRSTASIVAAARRVLQAGSANEKVRINHATALKLSWRRQAEIIISELERLVLARGSRI